MCTENLQKPEEEKKINSRKKGKINQLLDYAKKKYGCEFPKEFADKLCNLVYQNIIPTNAVVDAIVQEWNIWKPYVSEDSFNSFVQHELESMFKILTTSTFSFPGTKGYVGNKAKVIKTLPSGKSTSVLLSGKIMVDGVTID